MARQRPARTELRDSLRAGVNQQRDAADEMAGMFGGVDDPLHPFMPGGKEQPFRDWIDFTKRVCVPLVEAEDDEATVQAAMALYRKASPHFIAVSLVLALNQIASARTTTGSAATELEPADRPSPVPPNAEEGP